MTTVYIESLGCSKNRVDSEIMMGTLLDNGFSYTKDFLEAEIIIVNTCGFLTSAVTESINRILELGQLKESGSCQKLIVTGCMSERYKDDLLEEIPEIDGIIGTSDYTEILVAVRELLDKEEKYVHFEPKPLYDSKNFEVERALSTENYAYLKISEGCSNSCSFCNIPKLRGKLQSRSVESIQAEFKRLLNYGVKEINLIAEDTSSYALDLKNGQNLYTLVNSLLETDQSDFWLRIFYAYPNRFPLELFDLMAKDQRLLSYVDMPFQHISDSVLKSMNRRITRAEIEKVINYGFEKTPNLSLRTSLIVGYPNETEKDFKELLEFVQKGYFDNLGVFIYSHEDNIASYKLGDLVLEEVKIERRNLIMEAQQAVALKKNQSRVGSEFKVLIEGLSEETDLLLQGRSEFQGVDIDGVVLINDGQANAGEFKKVRITEAHPYDLVGEIID